MIIDFTVKNYRSFKEDASLSLIAEGLKDDGVAIRETDFHDRVLPVAGIFGQNAGGKSNIIKAFLYMQWAMLNSDHVNSPVNKHHLLQPFLLNRLSQSEPIHFEITLWDQELKSQYNYGFEVGVAGVISEWLEVTDRPGVKSRTRTVFERKRTEFKFDKTVRGDLKGLVKRVLDTALAINVFANLADPVAGRVLSLIRFDRIKVLDGSTSNEYMKYALERLYADDRLRSRVVIFIRKSDIAVSELQLTRSQFSMEDLPADMPAEIKAMMSQSNEPGYKYSLTSHHAMYDDSGSKLDEFYRFNFMEQESLGTQKLLAFAAILIDALDMGETIIFDELGSSLHPFITRKIVDLFQSEKTNRNGAQLIFTSHETFLLSSSPVAKGMSLRRDQIWLADKEKGEASVLRCLAEYKTRNEYELSKRYLEGRFGAVPVLRFDEGEVDGEAQE